MSSNPTSLEEAYEMLRVNNPQIRKRAVPIIVQEGDEAVPKLIEIVSDKEIAGREDAVEALGLIKNSDSIPAITSVLFEDPWFRVRRMAAWALGEIGDPSSAFELTRAIDDQDSNVGWEAILALEKIGSEIAQEAIVSALIDEARPDEIREGAARSLGRIRNPDTIPYLLQAFLSNGGKYHHGTMLSSWHAIQGMGEEAIAKLVSFLEDDDSSMQEAAAESLKEIGTEQAISLYEAWLGRRQNPHPMSNQTG